MFTFSAFDQHRNYYFKEEEKQEEFVFENTRAEQPKEGKPEDVKQPLFQCQICLRGYLSETEVESHKAKEHIKVLSERLRSGKNVCRACMRKKKTKAKLISHIKFNHLFSSQQSKRVERQIYICNHCNCLFFSKNMLIVHMGLVHKYKSVMKCPKCFKIINRSRMYSHMELHCVKSIGTCQICFTKLESRYAMLEHVKEKHKLYLKCDVCDYETDKSAVFAMHLDSKHGQSVDFGATLDIGEEVLERCFVPQSHAIPSTVRYIPTHTMGGLQLSGLVSICILCREICTTEAEMREHVSTVHTHTPTAKQPKKTHKCVCGESFSNSVLLKHHLFKLKDHRQVIEECAKEDEDGVGAEEMLDLDGTMMSSDDVLVVVEISSDNLGLAKRIVD